MTDLTLHAWAHLSRVVEPPCAELAPWWIEWGR
jgi:hypothetical protein